MRFSKTERRLFYSLAALSFFLLLAALTLIFLKFFYRPSSSVYRPIGETEPEAQFAQEIFPEIGLTYASFTDLFSGTGWLDNQRTSAWQDRKTSRMLFPPRLGWQELTQFFDDLKSITPTNFVKGSRNWLITGSQGDVFILDVPKRSIQRVIIPALSGFRLDAVQAEDDAWVVSGRKGNEGALWRLKLNQTNFASDIEALSFNLSDLGKPVHLSCRDKQCLIEHDLSLLLWAGQGARNIKLPTLLNPAQLVDVNIGNVGSSWLVGTSEKIDGRFLLRLFRFDGDNFKELIPQGLVSEYAGSWDFGGSGERWLAVYGAYQGIALEFSGDAYRSVSYYVPIRVMDSGFSPQILPLDSSRGAWLIFARERPKLLKIESGVAVDLSNELFGLLGATSALFARGAQEQQSFAVVKTAQGTKIFEFKNSGFDKSQAREVRSTKLNTQAGRVAAASITELISGTEGGNISFYLSNNGGQEWEQVIPGQRVAFAQQGGDLRWRAVFSPNKEQFATAWLGKIRVDFLLNTGSD